MKNLPDSARINALVAANVNAVYAIVQKFGIARHVFVDGEYQVNPLFEDAIQAGLLRLTQAAQSFDASRGVRFTSHAWRAVEGGVKDMLSGQQLVYEPAKKISARARAHAEYRSMSDVAREQAYGRDEHGNLNAPEPIYKGTQTPLSNYEEQRGEDAPPINTPAELTAGCFEDAIIARIDGDVDEAGAGQLVRDDLERRIAALPEALRVPLQLQLEGYSLLEMVARTGVPRATLQDRIRRGTAALRKSYAEAPGCPEDAPAAQAAPWQRSTRKRILASARASGRGQRPSPFRPLPSPPAVAAGARGHPTARSSPDRARSGRAQKAKALRPFTRRSFSMSPRIRFRKSTVGWFVLCLLVAIVEPGEAS